MYVCVKKQLEKWKKKLGGNHQLERLAFKFQVMDSAVTATVPPSGLSPCSANASDSDWVRW